MQSTTRRIGGPSTILYVCTTAGCPTEQAGPGTCPEHGSPLVRSPAFDVARARGDLRAGLRDHAGFEAEVAGGAGLVPPGGVALEEPEYPQAGMWRCPEDGCAFLYDADKGRVAARPQINACPTHLRRLVPAEAFPATAEDPAVARARDEHARVVASVRGTGRFDEVMRSVLALAELREGKAAEKVRVVFSLVPIAETLPGDAIDPEGHARLERLDHALGGGDPLTQMARDRHKQNVEAHAAKAGLDPSDVCGVRAEIYLGGGKWGNIAGIGREPVDALVSLHRGLLEAHRGVDARRRAVLERASALIGSAFEEAAATDPAP
jgi:hypothetical protein